MIYSYNGFYHFVNNIFDNSRMNLKLSVTVIVIRY